MSEGLGVVKMGGGWACRGAGTKVKRGGVGGGRKLRETRRSSRLGCKVVSLV